MARQSLTFTAPEGAKDMVEKVRAKRGHTYLGDAVREAAEVGFYILERRVLPGTTMHELELLIASAKWQREPRRETNPNFPPRTEPANSTLATQPSAPKLIPYPPTPPPRVIRVPPPAPPAACPPDPVVESAVVPFKRKGGAAASPAKLPPLVVKPWGVRFNNWLDRRSTMGFGVGLFGSAAAITLFADPGSWAGIIFFAIALGCVSWLLKI